ncbi:MAG TPA: RusA family crossover junction endodeoxyribonuclease, partial [Bryobacteraceae bacterium]|nr:RusA family crossover junction endodeoxyribonuclease [Bryobacteraceae bacterium]
DRVTGVVRDMRLTVSDMTLTFVIPAAPSANNLFFNAPGRGRVKSDRYRTWRQAAGNEMRIEGNRLRTWETIHGRAAVEITCNPRGDIDNRAKPIIDLLVHMAVLKDDRQIDDVRIIRGGDPARAIVTVREIAA